MEQFFLINAAQAQCILAGNGNGLSLLQGYKDGREEDIITFHHQVIIPSYKFDYSDQNLMCGNITEWGVGVFRDGGGCFYSLDLQVWRPSPTVDDSTGTGCYSLVGNNRFISIRLNDGVALVTPSPQD